MRLSRTDSGNTMAMTVVFASVLLLVLGFFVMNYSQLFGTQKEAQTAIDAASLQAAKDVSRIVIDGNFGKVGLVDDVPTGNNLNQRSVLGINTILATRRNALIVAKALGNTTMVYMARRDIELAKQDARKLGDTIMAAVNGAGEARDKNGNPINIRANAEAAYDQNSKRMGGQNKKLVPGSMEISIGQLDTPIVTNTPTPSPESYDPDTAGSSASAQVVSGTRFYRAYTPVDTRVAGENIQVTFAGVGNEPALVDADKFKPLTPGTCPAIVLVRARESFTANAPAQGGEKTAGEILVSAAAQVGAPRATLPTGTLCISFPQGFPPNQPVDFTSVRSIMNSSMLPADADSRSASPFRGWNTRGQGNWFIVKDGPVPGTPGGRAGRLERAPFKGRDQDDPAVALSFMVYDWVTSMGLRPNDEAIVKALSTDIRSYYNSNRPGSGVNFTARGIDIMPPAYAASTGNSLPVTAAIFGIDPSGENDPRDLSLWSNNPTAYRQQLANSWGYVPASSTIPANARLVSLSPQGEVVTTDGNPVSVLYELWEDMKKLETYSMETYSNANKVAMEIQAEINALIEKINQSQAEQARLRDAKKQLQDELARLSSDGQDAARRRELADQLGALDGQIAAQDAAIDQANAAIAAAQTKMGRAEATKANAQYCASVYIAMVENQKALTGGGVKRHNDKHYTVGGADFYPPQRAASEAEIKGEGMANTGQDQAAPGRDWCQSLADGKSQLYFYKHAATPQVGARPGNSYLFTPVLAQNAVPPNQNLMFLFNVRGDVTRPGPAGAGSIRLTALPRSPFVGMSTLEGQVQYQNRNALSTTGGGNAQVIWLVQARDLNANGGGTYFANTKAEGYVVSPLDWCHQAFYGNDAPGGPGEVCTSLVSEWEIRCPIPVPPGGFCGATTMKQADGTVVGIAYPCPPPPAMHG